MVRAGAGDCEVTIPNFGDAETPPRSCQIGEVRAMKKIVIVSVAILGLSTSAALAAKHHAKKPAASSAMSTPAPMMPFYTASSADKQLYVKNKHDSGVK